MSAALAYKDDYPEAANTEPPRDRPRLHLAYSRSEVSNDETSNTPNGVLSAPTANRFAGSGLEIFPNFPHPASQNPP